MTEKRARRKFTAEILLELGVMHYSRSRKSSRKRARKQRIAELADGKKG